MRGLIEAKLFIRASNEHDEQSIVILCNKQFPFNSFNGLSIRQAFLDLNNVWIITLYVEFW